MFHKAMVSPHFKTFWFGNTFRFLEKLQENIDGSSRPFIQLPLMVASDPTVEYCSQLRSHYWYIPTSQTPDFIRTLPFATSTGHSCYDSVASCGLRQSLRLSLFRMTLTVLRNSGQEVCRMFLTLKWSDIFPWLVWGSGSWWRLSQRWDTLLITWYRGDIASTLFFTSDINRYHLVKVVPLRFLHGKLILILFPTLFFGKESLNPAQTQGKRTRASLLRGGKFSPNISQCIFFLLGKYIYNLSA